MNKMYIYRGLQGLTFLGCILILGTVLLKLPELMM